MLRRCGLERRLGLGQSGGEFALVAFYPQPFLSLGDSLPVFLLLPEQLDLLALQHQLPFLQVTDLLPHGFEESFRRKEGHILQKRLFRLGEPFQHRLMVDEGQVSLQKGLAGVIEGKDVGLKPVV